MIRSFKQLASKFPLRFQQTLKRQWFAWKIRAKQFANDEPEYKILDKLVHPGDWVLDIGANIGQYSARMSELVGPNGRVLSFELVMESFELLTSNSLLFRFANISLFNVVASDRSSSVRMAVPIWETGGNNFYEAYITDDVTGRPALAISIDSLNIPNRVSLAKIDTEGHELAVLHGMRKLIERDRPILIVEANSNDTAEFLKCLGYSVEQGLGSSNYLCHFGIEATESIK